MRDVELYQQSFWGSWRHGRWGALNCRWIRKMPTREEALAHQITNALAEGLNSKIQMIKQAAYGFSSFENFKTAIFFHCGDLQLCLANRYWQLAFISGLGDGA